MFSIWNQAARDESTIRVNRQSWAELGSGSRSIKIQQFRLKPPTREVIDSSLEVAFRQGRQTRGHAYIVQGEIPIRGIFVAQIEGGDLTERIEKRGKGQR